MIENIFQFRCVSGASSGIGAEICVQLAQSGATVIGLARRVEKIDELSGRSDFNFKLEVSSILFKLYRLNGDKGGKIIGIKCDMEQQDEIYNAFKEVKN